MDTVKGLMIFLVALTCLQCRISRSLKTLKVQVNSEITSQSVTFPNHKWASNVGNVTPIPTQGELEEISIASEPDFRPSSVLQSDFRSQTPLKSLLKKQYGQDLPEIPVSVVDSRGRDSPHKAVHFSDVDQIKLMSLESLASTATSECSNNEPILRIHGTGGGSLPSRNQITSYPPGNKKSSS